MDGYKFLICLVATISYCSSAPDPLDTLNINVNLNGDAKHPEEKPPQPVPGVTGAEEKVQKTLIVGYIKAKMTKNEIEKEKIRIEKVCKCEVENLASVGAFILTYDNPKHNSISSLGLDPSKETGMEDQILTIFDEEIPTDPEFDQQWALHDLSNNADINAAEGWKTYMSDSVGGDPSGPSVVVAVIDTGVDYNHLDLKDVMWMNTEEIPGNGLDDDGNGYVDDVYGYDFNYGDADPIDGHYHGTHCAGIIAAKENNGKGIAGVASFAQGKVKIMAVKGLSDGGKGYLSNLLKCLNYAIHNGARISSNSWGGGSGNEQLWKTVLQNNPDHLFVAAAGNLNRLIDDSYRPWTCGKIKEPNLLCVASSNKNDTKSWFSNYGKDYVHVFAPGTDIYSTTPGNGYDFDSGTSMACPHVSGLAALVRTMKPAMNAQQVREAIEANVQKKPQYENLVSSGGLIDMGNTLKGVNDYDCTCGIKNPRIDELSRIVGGENTGIFEYPWMVSIKTKKVDYRHRCGGVLIASQWVLTAAHCNEGPLKGKEIFIFLGEHDQTRQDETDKTKIFKASKRITHPWYTHWPQHPQHDKDIALIKLDEPADLQIYTPACLPDVNQFFPGSPATVTGWGSMQQGDPSLDPIYPAQLQWMNITVGDDQYCQEHDNNQEDDYETMSLTCSTPLGIPGKGECRGDSGGPMTVDFFGRHYLVGLVVGGQCCGCGKITKYSSAAKLKDWIDQTIEDNGGAAYCTPTPFPFEE